MTNQMTLDAFAFTKSVAQRRNEAIVEMLLALLEVVTEKNLECYFSHERFCSN